MYIEDILQISLQQGLKFNSWEQSLIASFYSQISNGSALTEKQSKLAVKTLKKYLDQLNQICGYDFTSSIETPIYRHGIRTVNNKKNISITKNSENEKVIRVEFPFNEKLLENIRRDRPNLNFAAWNRDEKSWFFSLDEASILFLIDFIEIHSFECDEEFSNYVRQIKKIQSEYQKYVPKLVKNQKVFELANVSAYTPKINESDLIKSLFEARKLGILEWDESIKEDLEKLSIPEEIKVFLKTSPGKTVLFNKTDNLDSLKIILKHLSPCLFIIPGGSEFEKCQFSLELLKSIGISNSEISVLFRLPNETHADFNKFVKDNALNSPISSNTRAVFISGKIPKTVLESKISFKSLINYGFYNVHYTIRDYVNRQPNVIHVLNSNQQREMIFL